MLNDDSLFVIHINVLLFIKNSQNTRPSQLTMVLVTIYLGVRRVVTKRVLSVFVVLFLRKLFLFTLITYWFHKSKD